MDLDEPSMHLPSIPTGLLSMENTLADNLWERIFLNLFPTDLASLCRVSKHFRELSAKLLYRDFHIIFPEQKALPQGSLGDGLAHGLDTFVTSDYDYARHLQEIRLESHGGEIEYHEYHYTVSCGRFMNTLLLLTLRKATNLQTFRWEIRVQLSNAVFKALHGIKYLKCLHLRMPAQNNIVGVNAEVPSTLPKMIPGQAVVPHRQPPTISGFKDLSTLVILDMDSIDYIGEIKQCIESSSLNLKTLKLSFSRTLAAKACKPVVPEAQPEDDDDEEDEDDFGQLMVVPQGPGMAPPGAADPNGPVKEKKAEEEKARQVKFLEKIFGLDKTSIPAETGDPAETPPDSATLITIQIMQKIRDMAAPEPFLQFMTDSVNAYLEKLKVVKNDAGTKPKGVGVDVAKPTNTGDAQEAEIEDNSDNGPEARSIFDNTKGTKAIDSDTSNPDNYDVEAPEEDDSLFDEVVEFETRSDEVELGTVEAADTNIVGNPTKEAISMEANSETQKLSREAAQLSNEHTVVDSLNTHIPAAHTSDSDKASQENSVNMSQYIRETRGLSLDTLALCLIPVKASVLSRAIDIGVLKDITLLSVGSQVSFWNTMAEKNKLQPLPLRKINTDSVSLPFLSLINQLEQVDDLIMLESKKKSESMTGPPTDVTIKQIKHLVLKKHAHTLKVLSVRNECGLYWDFDISSISILSAKAKKLEELAVSFNISVMPTLFRRMNELATLRALHVVRFSFHDNLGPHELRKFALDSVQHRPEMSLEYIAVDNALESIHREYIDTKKKKVKKTYNDGKIVMLQNGTWVVGDPKKAFPAVQTNEIAPTKPGGLDWGEESEDEEVAIGYKTVLTPVRTFASVDDVRIFRSEVLHGRL